MNRVPIKDFFKWILIYVVFYLIVLSIAYFVVFR